MCAVTVLRPVRVVASSSRKMHSPGQTSAAWIACPRACAAPTTSRPCRLDRWRQGRSWGRGRTRCRRRAARRDQDSGRCTTRRRCTGPGRSRPSSTPGSSWRAGVQARARLDLFDHAAGDPGTAVAGRSACVKSSLVGVDDDRAPVGVEQRLGDVMGEREVCRGGVQPAPPVVVGNEVGEVAGVMVGVLASGVFAVGRAVRIEVPAGSAEGDAGCVGSHKPMVWMWVPCRPAVEARHLDVDVHDPAGILGEVGEAGDTARPGDRGAGMDRASLAAACVAISVSTPAATVSRRRQRGRAAEMVFILVPPKNTVATCGVVGRQSVASRRRFGSRPPDYRFT